MAEQLIVIRLPGRKRMALCIEYESKIEVLAYFQNDDRFKDFKRICGGRGLVYVPNEAETRPRSRI